MENLSSSTVIRSLNSGHEGIIIDSYPGPANTFMYVIEWRHGETTAVSSGDIEPIDSPIHALLDSWHEEGKRMGYEYLFVGTDKDGRLHRFFAPSSKSYGNIVRLNRHLKFRFWKLRGG
jgi:hypothetical protein